MLETKNIKDVEYSIRLESIDIPLLDGFLGDILSTNEKYTKKRTNTMNIYILLTKMRLN